MYQIDSDDRFPPWISPLYPSYIGSTDVYHCPMDKNENKTPQQWDPHPLDNDPPNKFSAAYDRPGSTGRYGQNPNSDVIEISYFYEFSQATCNWGWGKTKNKTVPANSASWEEVKMRQLIDKDGNEIAGDKYDESLFPMIRCFWHMRGTENSSAPAYNVSMLGNVFQSRLEWELGVWSP